ncbi:MAG: helix-turn-helix transcriptional regulator [Roseimicrobium sp.]
MLQHAREIAPSVSWDILVLIKRSGGMCVNELSAALNMSYMGVKQHCDELKKGGFVDTWRRPKQTGRPEKIYRPADKLDRVLPNWGSELCLGLLSLVAQTYGEVVPERLIYGFLQQKVERWNSRLKGKTPKERAAELAKLRNGDGWMCEAVEDTQGLRIVDHHSPMAEVARLYPAVWDLEGRVLSRVFGHTLSRRALGLRVEWVISEVESPTQASSAAAALGLPAQRGSSSRSTRSSRKRGNGTAHRPDVKNEP